MNRLENLFFIYVKMKEKNPLLFYRKLKSTDQQIFVSSFLLGLAVPAFCNDSEFIVNYRFNQSY